MKPLVSVIIPCFNAEQYINEAIESAVNQTYSKVEVIVIDDGSSDRSVEVIQSFGDQVRFEVIDHKGACTARNRGLQLSKGEYIQFLDADDLIVADKIERQLPFLVDDRADLVFCKGYLFGDGRGLRPKKSMIKSPQNIDPFIYCLNQGLSTEGPLHKRSCLDKIGGFNETLPRAQETELHIRLGASNIRIHLLDELLYKHRHHDGSRITRTKSSPDYMLQFFIDLEKTLIQENHYEMTEERVQALAGKIFQFSIYAFRNGAEESAIRGFRKAQTLCKELTYNERDWYKLLARFFGPLVVEHLLKQVRNIRDLLYQF